MMGRGAKALDGFDLVVIGGGLLGTIISLRAGLAGWRILCLRRSDRDLLRAETLRNQAWLQSGALYCHRSKDLAAALFAAGRELADFFALKLEGRSTGRKLPGLLVQPPAYAPGFIKATSELGIQTEPASESEARDAAGPFWSDGDGFWIPDTVFPEAEVLSDAREQARATRRVVFRESSGGATLLEHDQTPGFLIEFQGFRFSAERTVIAAGAGAPELLSSLGVKIPSIRVYRTPLVVLAADHDLKLPVFVDRGKHLAVTRHSVRLGERHTTRLVCGVKVAGREPLKDVDLERRTSSEEERDPTVSALPSELASAGYRTTVGYEPVREGSGPIDPDDRWFSEIRKYDRLIVAHPGRATLALKTADEVLRHLGLNPSRRRRPSSSQLEPPPDFPGNDWEDPISMHFEPYWDTRLNEVD